MSYTGRPWFQPNRFSTPPRTAPEELHPGSQATADERGRCRGPLTIGAGRFEGGEMGHAGPVGGLLLAPSEQCESEVGRWGWYVVAPLQVTPHLLFWRDVIHLREAGSLHQGGELIGAER